MKILTHLLTAGKKRINLVVFLLYFFLSLFFLRGTLFSKGIVIGADWAFPFTLSQMREYFKNGFYTWTARSLFGAEQFFLSSLPFYILIGFFVKLGINGAIYIRLLLVLAFTLPAFTMYLLARFLNCGQKAAFFSGFIYFTLPFFLDYAAIGWLLVLFAMGILPLAVITFIKSVKTRRLSYSILTALLFLLGMIQSQSLVWYPLVFLFLAFYLVKDKSTFFVYLRSLFTVLFVFLFLGAFGELSFFLGGDSGLLKTRLGLSLTSLGTWAKLSNLNLLRNWGKLFNFQYESSYPKILTPISFVLPFLAYLSLLFLKEKKIVCSFVFLSFVSVVAFNLGPDIIVKLPLSDLVRDIARFSVMTSFSYVILAGLSLNFMLEHQQRQVRIIGCLFCLLIIINTYPFWIGGLSRGQNNLSDARLRTYQFPQESITVENKLAKEPQDFKVFYLPMGDALRIVGNEDFYGMYNAMRDIFAYYSPKPGSVSISDKEMGSAADLIIELNEMQSSRQFGSNFSDMIGLMGVKYVVLRKDEGCLLGVSGSEATSLLEGKEALVKKEEWDKIAFFENLHFLPHFYVPKNLIYVGGNDKSFTEAVALENSGPRFGIYSNGNVLSWTDDFTKRINDVFVRGELKNALGEDEFRTAAKEIDLPSVNRSPRSFLYPLVLIREKYEEWKLRNEPEKLFEKHLFYAGRRINEAVIYNFDGLTNYRKEMMGTLGVLEELKQSKDKNFLKLLMKLEGILWGHRGNIKKIERLRDWEIVFKEIEKKIAEFRVGRDFSKLVYKLSVPKEGEYEIYVKDGGDTNIQYPVSSIINENWKLLETKYFPEGEQELVLPFSGISENLVDENLKIKDYSPNSVYRFSFDYKTSGNSGFFFLKEGAGEIAKVELPSSGDESRHFEMFFKSFSNVADANIHLSISVAEEKNLKVERIYQPEVLLKNIQYPIPRQARDKLSNIQYQPPKITFVKINPTKYRVKVEEAKEPYTLVFSESFHQGWKAYIDSTQYAIRNTQNEFGNIVASYFDGEIKEGTHRDIFLDRNTFETWGKEALPEERHLLINSYANSWYITTEDSVGREDYEIIVEFQPQRLFYAGLVISLLTLMGCLGYLIYDRNFHEK